MLGMHGRQNVAHKLTKHGRAHHEHHGGAHDIMHRDAHGNLIGVYGSGTWTLEEQEANGLLDRRSYFQRSHGATSVGVQALRAQGGKRWDPALLERLTGGGGEGKSSWKPSSGSSSSTTTTKRPDDGDAVGALAGVPLSELSPVLCGAGCSGVASRLCLCCQG